MEGIDIHNRECDAAKVTTITYANQPDSYVGGEAQQLAARELLAHYYLAVQVKPYQMGNCLTKINADRV
jgi:hypothetical protein